jgi:hypothetical protein
MEWNEQPWTRWSVPYTERGGTPVLSETNLWYLQAHHPDAVEETGKGTYLLRLDRTYRAALAPGRSFYVCLPVGGRAG